MDASTTAVAALLRKSAVEIESQVRGSSMHPTLADGSRIRIRCGHSSVSRGDIVAILADPPIAHRVVGQRRRGARTYVLTRGDASWFCDVPVAEGDILGLVTAHDDGRGWRPPGACPRTSRLTAALSWLSQRATLAALGVSEALASVVARGTAALAKGWDRA